MPTDMRVANTILQQLGGNRFIAMTGARQFVGGSDSLHFSLGRFPGLKINKVRITLTPRDLYKLEFYQVRGTNVRKLAERDDVYAGDLRDVFTEVTGLDTTLGTISRKNPGEGDLFFFHGAFKKKADARAKQDGTPGSFLRTVWYASGPRYAVLSPRTAQNPHRLPVVSYRKDVSEITSTARQRRSHHPSVRPKGRKICALCRSKKNIVLDHKNGNQSDIRRANHRWLCKSCNRKEAIRLKRVGKGIPLERPWNKDRPKVGTLVQVKKSKAAGRA